MPHSLARWQAAVCRAPARARAAPRSAAVDGDGQRDGRGSRWGWASGLGSSPRTASTAERGRDRARRGLQQSGGIRDGRSGEQALGLRQLDMRPNADRRRAGLALDVSVQPRSSTPARAGRRLRLPCCFIGPSPTVVRHISHRVAHDLGASSSWRRPSAFTTPAHPIPPLC